MAKKGVCEYIIKYKDEDGNQKTVAESEEEAWKVYAELETSPEVFDLGKPKKMCKPYRRRK